MTPPLHLTPERERLLQTDGHLLVLGGPGSGKTTIALLKAGHEIRAGNLHTGQKVLFLSFARATVARVAEHARILVSKHEMGMLEINTYHGFAWNLLQSHGYLLHPHRKIRLLPPPEAAARLAHVASEERSHACRELFEQEGLLGFDIFASVAENLLSRSKSLTSVIADAYPILIVDEFQDTNADEWAMIQCLGEACRILALADADQRIYEFRGADPARIGEFITAYSPTQFDFGNENNRSDGTDITVYGNDLLTGANKGKTYHDVALSKYGFYKDKFFVFPLKTKLLEGIRRLHAGGNAKWSIAILVPSKRLMLSVSDYLSREVDGLPKISHEVAIDYEGIALSAVTIAGLLGLGGTQEDNTRRFLSNLIAHIRGRKGNTQPSKADIELAKALDGYLNTGNIRGSKRIEIINEASRLVSELLAAPQTGDPGHDWLHILNQLKGSSAPVIARIAEDAMFFRLLKKGAILRERLNEIWKESHTYQGAQAAVSDALLQEHFSASTRDWSGINVMTIHKSKGKEFDEVFIFEGYRFGKIVREGATPNEVAQARLALRVAVTRARKRATILSPKGDYCILL